MSTSFLDRFNRRKEEIQSLLCVGIDPDPTRLPDGYENNLRDWSHFIDDVVRSTHRHTVAYKTNLAFFEALTFGQELLRHSIQTIRKLAPSTLLIADGKRGDIGNTAAAYARACFEELCVDAMTVNPYMGLEALEPFYAYKDHAVIVLCLTSNPGSSEYQMSGEPPLYQRIAGDVQKLNEINGNFWLVVGATHHEKVLKPIREVAPDIPLLVPGIGAQGGNLENIVLILGNQIIINAGRSILYAAKKRDQLPEMAASAAGQLHEQMAPLLKQI